MAMTDNVLIIGAGAHVPYKMPTSASLKKTIKHIYEASRGDNTMADPRNVTGRRHFRDLTRLAHELQIVSQIKTQQSPNRKFLGQFSVSESTTTQMFQDFLDSFCNAHVSSIDAYLSNLHKESNALIRETYALFGKLLIAYLILDSECASPLGTRDDDWIHFFLDQFSRKNPENLFENPPKIITFNYDRIFERILFTHLTQQHKCSQEESIQMIQNLDIVHVYGSLGSFTDWFENIDEVPIRFYVNAMNSISVVAEERSSEKRLVLQETIKDKLAETQNAYFLGYGFDEENNQLLKPCFEDSFSATKDIYSSTIGIKKADILRISRTLINSNKILQINQFNESQPISCLELISSEAPMRI